MTLSRDEDSSLRHWSSRLIQALQILDLEVDHEKIVQVADESRQSRRAARGRHQRVHRGLRGGHRVHQRPQGHAGGRARRVEQGHRALRARRVRRPGRRRAGPSGPSSAGRTAAVTRGSAAAAYADPHPWDMLAVRAGWTCWCYVQWPRRGLGMSRGVDAPAGHALRGRRDGHGGVMSSGRGRGWACPAAPGRGAGCPRARPRRQGLLPRRRASGPGSARAGR